MFCWLLGLNFFVGLIIFDGFKILRPLFILGGFLKIFNTFFFVRCKIVYVNLVLSL